MNDICDCPKCFGDGFVKGYELDDPWQKCPICGGTGEIIAPIADMVCELRAENQVLRNEIDKLIREVRNEKGT